MTTNEPKPIKASLFYFLRSFSWLPWLLFALPAFVFGMFLAKILLQRRELSASFIKQFCLYLLIVNAAFNLLVLALL